MDIGARLRDARRARKLTLRDISNRTKIPVRALEAIERNELHQLPRGIFVRGFLRSYAVEVGLDPDALLNECFPPAVVERPVEPGEIQERPIRRRHFASHQSAALLGIAILILLLVAGIHSARSRKPVGSRLQSKPLGISAVGSAPVAVVSNFSSAAIVQPKIQPSGARGGAQPNSRSETDRAVTSDVRPTATIGEATEPAADQRVTDPSTASGPAVSPLDATSNQPQNQPAR